MWMPSNSSLSLSFSHNPCPCTQRTHINSFLWCGGMVHGIAEYYVHHTNLSVALNQYFFLTFGARSVSSFSASAKSVFFILSFHFFRARVSPLFFLLLRSLYKDVGKCLFSFSCCLALGCVTTHLSLQENLLPKDLSRQQRSTLKLPFLRKFAALIQQHTPFAPGN